MSNVVQLFPTPESSTAVAYPLSARVVGTTSSVEVDFISGTACEIDVVDDDEGGAPQVYSKGETVVLDLGELTPYRTLITLDAVAASEWAYALEKAARAARRVPAE